VNLQPERSLEILPLVGVPPTLDGDLDDSAWRGAAKLEGFVRYGSGEFAKDSTIAFVTYDSRALYIAARLTSSAMDKLRSDETARDADVWRDDCLEIFVDSGHTHREWRQFVTNSVGARFDARMPGGKEGRGKDWNAAGWEVKGAKGADAWTVEMKLPFSDLGGAPKPGDVWGFNVCREAPSTGELSMWNDTGGRFTRVSHLADLVFVEAPAKLASTDVDVRFEEKAGGDYLLRVALPTSMRPVRYRVWTQESGREPEGREGEAEEHFIDGEFALPVHFKPETEGEGKIGFTLYGVGGERICYRAFTFDVRFPFEASLDRLVLIPSPQEIKLGDGHFAVSAATRIVVGGGADDLRCAVALQQGIAREHRLTLTSSRHGAIPEQNSILVGCPESSPAVARALRSSQLMKRLTELPAEGFLVIVSAEQVVLAGRDGRGTYYAVRTFLQLLLHGVAGDDGVAADSCTIVDWPEHSFRAYMLFSSGWPQDPFDPEEVKRFIYSQVAGLRYNTLVWQMKAGYRYSTHPQFASRCATTREELRDIIRFARDNFVELIPNTNVLGHANWIVLRRKELMEDGKPSQICTRHPEIRSILSDVLDEMLDVFDHPKRLHVGLDEVRWKTFNLSEEQRCTRCLGVPKWQIYAEHVTWLHDYLAERGVEMWMWGDMLLATHNGGPPFDCAKALEVIPKDIVLCNWSAEYSAGSCQFLCEKGFRVVKANSNQIRSEDVSFVMGNLASFWYRHPWCPFSQIGPRGLMMRTAYAAEFSWRTNREDVSLPAFRRSCDENVLRLLAHNRLPRDGWQPVDMGTCLVQELAEDNAGLDARHLLAGELTCGPVALKTTGKCAFLSAEGQRVAGPVKVGGRISDLALLHTAVFPTEKKARKAFFKPFLAPNEGVVMAELRVAYVDGTALSAPLRIGMEIADWQPRAASEYLVNCPYILRFPSESCRTDAPGTTDAIAYLVHWINPRPHARVESVSIHHAGGAAPYAWFAISARRL
ncbi:MAG: family 20 glycosylhydrolase, partial [Lentisphaeria bacterium]|nr:family 20 glycosylhydrolase [Lentisphaeria bacterium]